MNEWEFIEKIREKALKGSNIQIGIGDDCAVIKSGEKDLVIACDSILEGKHFLMEEASPEQIAYKSIAVNISDLASMAAWPEALLLSVSFPKNLPDDFLQRFLDSFLETCEKYNISIIGGDTTSWNYGLTVTVTMIGRPMADKLVLRSGARSGDIIAVSGSLGNSLANGHHLNFKPRLEEAKIIQELLTPSSMIDISDGLISELRHLSRASQLKAKIYEDKIPIDPSLSYLDKQLALEKALSDGEDFELCFSFPKHKLENFKRLGFSASIIGEFTTQGPLVHNQDGLEIELKGFEHRW